MLQIKTEDVGNLNLVSAKASSVGIGATLRFASMFLTADWYRKKVWNQASRPSLQFFVNLENRDQNLLEAAQVLRAGGSETETIKEIVRPLINHRDNNSRTENLALRAGAAWQIAWALLDLDINCLRTIDSCSRVQGVKQPGDFLLHRVHATLCASRGDLTAHWNVHSMSGYTIPPCTGRWNSWTGYDLAGCLRPARTEEYKPVQ